ncbi:hypothetical protein NQ317_001120 [Molorchus minor]|uniref:Protein CLEC16A n=1 Tax=Molorchus minor TaxID=1323400 RepID=A0ABQ9JIN6_9CUCU|nr:hypothetical protein NQ317_001120 [Molorchus minor]
MQNMFRSRSWFGGGWGRPKNLHSLEHLKYLYNVLSRNQTVSEHNRGLLVESLRSIAEILIWGDQNDSSVFDSMRQRSGGSSFVCVQLLQTLNILFENIRNETSLYYLLSNNHHTNDFPLYTEAIKFFNHPESMVRIAVRTLTLNVYKVEDASMLAFIRDRTAAPYFSNIVWFIGKHIQELDTCVRNDADHQSQNRLADLVAEHLDHLHYLNDILCLNITDLNHSSAVESVTNSMVKASLTPRGSENNSPKVHEFTNGKVSCVVALFLLSQVFLILSHSPLVQTLAWIILKTDKSIFDKGADKLLDYYEKEKERKALEDEACAQALSDMSSRESSTSKEDILEEHLSMNITDEEKQRLATSPAETAATIDHPFLETVYNALDCSENDYATLFALCLLYAMANNAGVTTDILEQVLRPKKSFISKSTLSSKDVRYSYNTLLIEKLLHIVILSCQPSCKVRLVTLELTLKLLVQLVMCDGKSILTEAHKQTIESAKTQSTALLRNFYKSEEIFLDMFEHEYCDMSKGSLNVEWLCMDSAILLPPTGTPMTGIDFTKRLPCGEVERARRAIRVFFLVRNLVLTLNGELETQLPLTNPQSCVQIDQALDLSISRCVSKSHNSDLIACTILYKDGTKMRRFLVIDVLQLILVEPDTKRLGWGVAKLVGFLQDIEVTGDKDDSRAVCILPSTGRDLWAELKHVRRKCSTSPAPRYSRPVWPRVPLMPAKGMYIARSTGRGSRENRPLLICRGGREYAAPRRETSPTTNPKTEESRKHREGESPNRISNLKKRTAEKRITQEIDR